MAGFVDEELEVPGYFVEDCDAAVFIVGPCLGGWEEDDVADPLSHVDGETAE